MTKDIYGVWLTNVDSEVLFSRANLQSAIQKLSSIGFNTLYPSVWNAGYTLYPSQLTKNLIGIDVDPKFQGRDMLAEIIEIGHQYNLRIIPWFEYGLMAFNKKGNDPWSTTKKWSLKAKDARKFFDISNPKVRAFFTQLIAEVVTNYKEIDGIQFDDHFGVHLSATKNEEETLNSITELWKTLFHTVKLLSNNKCIVSLSPNEWAKNHLQNWEEWVQKGFVEELIFQIYEADLEKLEKEDFAKSFSKRINKLIVNRLDRFPENDREFSVGIGLYAGTTKLSPALDKLKIQIDTVRNLMSEHTQIRGLSFFFYESLWHRLSKDENDTLIKETLKDRENYFEKEFMNKSNNLTLDFGQIK